MGAVVDTWVCHTDADPKVEPVRSRLSRKYTNAYMLVYVRETELPSVLCPVTVDDVPAAFLERMEREKEELVPHAPRHRQTEKEWEREQEAMPPTSFRHRRPCV
jgi:hypothetical protein